MQQTEKASVTAAPLAPAAELNYYRILDVDRGASRLAIREAYLRLKNAYGSGSVALYSLISEEEAAEQLAQIEAAFRVLSDEVARRAYDLETGGKRAGASQIVPPPPRDEFAVNSFSDDLAAFTSPEAEGVAPSEAIIRTHRSMLPIIKLKANRAPAAEVQTRLTELLRSGDPADGDLLRRLREACEVSEEEICERTKVTIGYIQAIESNRFERLPQAVFVKGFLRSYCRYLCIPDAETLVTAFSARLMDWQANRKG